MSGLHILSWVAGFENSAVAWYVAVSQKLAAGTAGLIDALAEHERVFATVGVSHAVMLEPALLASIEKRNRGAPSRTAR